MLSDEQNEIINAIASGENILITGVAGTGKSFTIEKIREKYECVLTATTGIAALNIGGQTIHKWSGIGIGIDDAKTIYFKLIKQKFNFPRVQSIRNCKILIIDEISMLSDLFLDKLDDVLQLVRGKPGLPFGGIQIIATGDFLQLPPVNKDGTHNFCFKSKAWNSAKIKTYMLTKVFRQDNQEFVNTLMNIRQGKFTESDYNLLSTRFNKNSNEAPVKPIIVYPTNNEAELENGKQLAMIQSPSVTYQADDKIMNESISPIARKFLLEQLDRDCLAPKTLILKNGAHVMLLKNIEPGSGLVNGSMGIVKEMEKDYVCVYFPRANLTWSFTPKKWDIHEGSEVVATRSQIPLKLAYAITVHKCQGMTLDYVECTMDRIFENGQAYVALSRAKSLDGLYINNFKPELIKANRQALKFYDDLKNGIKRLPIGSH